VKRITQSRYAPAIASAVLVALIAIAGVAVAGTATSSKKKKGLTAAQARAIADQEIAAQAPRLSVAKAANATNADNATNAGSAVSANPIAFAHINSDGSIDQAKSKNFTNATVTRPTMGLYCFYQLGFAFKGAQVTTDYDDSSNEIGPQFGSTASGTCTPAANAYVSLPTSNGSAQANAGFFIVFYN
jgi:hypothetical protein